MAKNSKWSRVGVMRVLVLIVAYLLQMAAKEPEESPESKYDFMKSRLDEFAVKRDETLAGVSAAMIRKMQYQRIELARMKIATLAYLAIHHSLPERMDQAMGDEYGLGELPRDYFRPGKAIYYFLNKGNQEAVFYSVGPDGKDDKGAVELSVPGDYKADEINLALLTHDEPTTKSHDRPTTNTKEVIPAGDIVDRINLKELAENRKEIETHTNILHDKLVALRDKTGRDNAMIYYIEASYKMDTAPYSIWEQYEQLLMVMTIREGWTEKSKPLAGVSVRYAAAMADIRKGIALDHAVNDLCLGETNHQPNFAAAHELVKMLCVEGRRLESVGKPAEAMDDYLPALTMGRDFGVPDAVFLDGLISTALQTTALDQIARLATKTSLDRAVLERAASRLKTVESTRGRFVDWYGAENKWTHANNERLLEVAKKEAPDEVIPIQMMDSGQQKIYEWDKIRFGIPYWEREAKGYGQADYKKMIEGLQKLQKMWPLPDYGVGEIRDLHGKSRLLETRVIVALELYKKDKGAYPDSMASLVPSYLESAPIDPFCGKPIQYRKISQESYKVWGVGPDLKNETAAISYDPTNGDISAGDVVFSRR